jgi:hypothetical protein
MTKSLKVHVRGVLEDRAVRWRRVSDKGAGASNQRGCLVFRHSTSKAAMPAYTALEDLSLYNYLSGHINLRDYQRLECYIHTLGSILSVLNS